MPVFSGGQVGDVGWERDGPPRWARARDDAWDDAWDDARHQA